ncbi:MAG: phosphoribosylformylglycinamidine cyclo-ligase [Bacteroidetes bacterium]|nr:phosphoribosylformylglycinamidine cyclo-ligase [Bacteroidota bacterium]
MSVDYTSAGVNIEAGNLAVEKIKDLAASTFTPQVLTGLGSFGAFYDLGEVLRNYKHPVLVQSIDGVGTKIIAAGLAGKYDSIGRDLLSACANDIVVHGAKPLTFLDYIANDTLDPDVVAEIVSGMAAGCREEGISLIGGETAEMPGTYLPGEHDLVGIVTGVVEKDAIINGSNVQPGDVILAAASSGLHTNGFSLARKVLFEIAGLTVTDILPGSAEDGDPRTVGDVLLEPHINYTSSVHALLKTGITVKSMAHITGGGLIENVPRVMPKTTNAVFTPGSWPVPRIFRVIEELGGIDQWEMYRAFNMGIGLTVTVPANEKDKALAAMGEAFNIPVFEIGRITEGTGKTVLTGISRTPEGADR